MSTAELKINIINRISNLEDDAVIEKIKRLLDFELENKIYQLSDDQLNRIQEAKNEYTKGRIVSNEQANKDIEQWLNEK